MRKPISKQGVKPLVAGRIRNRALAAALLVLGVVAALPGQTAPVNSSIYPPWQQGRNNDAIDRGLDFTVPEVDNLADFHGDPTDPKLVLFVGGNSFFAMAPLVAAFEARHPDFRGRLFWETIPPGRLSSR
jgi:hypothetical protein